MFRAVPVVLSLLALSLSASEVRAAQSSGTETAARVSGGKGTASDLLTASLKEMDIAENRTNLIKTVGTYCSEIKDSFPTNSPTERAWLETETSGDTKRRVRAMSSPEFGREKAQEFTFLCEAYTKEYEAGTDKKHQLIGIAHTFVRFSGDAENYAKINGIDGQKLGFPLLSFYAEVILKAALLETE